MTDTLNSAQNNEKRNKKGASLYRRHLTAKWKKSSLYSCIINWVHYIMASKPINIQFSCKIRSLKKYNGSFISVYFLNVIDNHTSLRKHLLASMSKHISNPSFFHDRDGQNMSFKCVQKWHNQYINAEQFSPKTFRTVTTHISLRMWDISDHDK